MDTKKKNNKSSGANKNHDVAGIICVVISSFFLICLVTPLLSDIGIFVKNLTTGLLGYMSYPIVLCTLFYGVMLLMNKKLAVTAKQITFIVLMSIFALLILQTALDSSKMSGGLGEYLSGLISFDANNTTAGRSVGGVVFGMLAFCFKAMLSFVGAYILFGLLLVLFGSLLVFDVRNGKKKAVSRQKKTAAPQPFVKGQREAQPVRDIFDNTLFVGTIERTKKMSQSGDFTSMYSPVSDTLPRYDTASSQAPYAPSSPIISREDEQRQQAKNKLFGMSDEHRKIYDNQIKMNMQITDNVSGRSNYLIDEDSGILNGSYSAKPTFNQSPSYGGYASEPKKAFPDVAIPPSKDVSGNYYEGPIMNGEEMSQIIKDSNRLRKPHDVSFAPEKPVEMPPIVTGNPSVAQDDYVEPQEERFDDLPPIVNGDLFVGKKSDGSLQGDKSLQKPQIVEPKQPEIIDADKYAQSQPQPKREPVKPAEAKQPPIILGSNNSFSYEYPSQVEQLDNEAEELDNLEGQSDFVGEHSEEPYYQPVSQPINIQENEDEIDAPLSFDGENSTLPQEEDFDKVEFDFDIPEEIIEEEEDQSAQDVADDVKVDHQDDNEQEFADEVEQEYEVDEHLDQEQEPQEAVQDHKEEQEPPQSFLESSSVVEAKIPDSLKLVDEEVDMSETREEITNDNTGYYVSEGFNHNVGEISVKLSDAKLGLKSGGSGNNQINMDDYDVILPESAKPKKKKKKSRYTPPPIDLLINSSTPLDDGEDCEAKANLLEESLHDLKIGAKVINITRGPAVTRYELEMPLGQSVNKITGRGDDIAYALAADGKIRIEAPIRGKRAVGVEVPNKSIAIVSLREIIESKEFNESKNPLTLALGKDITGKIKLCNLDKMPHLLIAGTTGSGKSACLSSIIISILYKTTPDDVRLILIDPKQVEFVQYRNMPHLLMKNIINDSTQACNSFKWAREEMDRRYAIFANHSVRNLADYNESEVVKSGLEPKLPRIVIIVDELSELMLAKNSKELEQNIMSLAQKARAAGVHLILATQRPSVDVLTGTIKANFPSRIAFAVRSIPDSRTILDQIGAEALLGRGDMLYAPIDANDPIRIQGAYVTTEEIEQVVKFVRENNEVDYDESAENVIMKKMEEESVSISDDDKNSEATEDPLMKEVLRRVIELQTASASQIQRRFSVGYNRAARILDQMEEKGYVGPNDGKAREIFITREKFKELYGEDV